MWGWKDEWGDDMSGLRDVRGGMWKWRSAEGGAMSKWMDAGVEERGVIMVDGMGN